MYDGSQNDAQLNREILIRELRENPPNWWDFSDCNKCAIAVSIRLGLITWDKDRSSAPPVEPLMHAFGLSGHHVTRTFYTGRIRKTPADVAFQLEVAPFT